MRPAPPSDSPPSDAPPTPAPAPLRPTWQGQKLSLGSAFTAGALVSSVGKWLDRGLTAMMGGGDGAGEAGGARGARLEAAACQLLLRSHGPARPIVPAEAGDPAALLPAAAGAQGGRHSRNPSTSSLDVKVRLRLGTLCIAGHGSCIPLAVGLEQRGGLLRAASMVPLPRRRPCTSAAPAAAAWQRGRPRLQTAAQQAAAAACSTASAASRTC